MHYILALVLSLFLSSSMAGTDEDLVSSIVVDTFTTVSERLQSAATQEDAVSIINEHLLNMLDLPVTARIVVGKHWRKATPEQRTRFVEVFQVMMIRSYSRFLIGEDAKNVDMEVIRTTRKGTKRILVRTKMTTPDGRSFEVDYTFYFNKERDRWLVIDVAVEGISVALSFRSGYQRIIKAKGIDSLISQMEAKNIVASD